MCFVKSRDKEMFLFIYAAPGPFTLQFTCTQSVVLFIDKHCCSYMLINDQLVINSLESTGDNGRQPPLLPPRLRATRVDTIIHNYRLSAAP